MKTLIFVIQPTGHAASGEKRRPLHLHRQGQHNRQGVRPAAQGARQKNGG